MKILLPTDFSENAELATDYALDLARRTKGSVLAFHAYDIPYYERSMTTSLLTEMKEAAEENMKEFENKHLKEAGVEYDCRVMVGNPIRLSKELSRRNGIEVVVMGTKGASGIEEFLIGSNAASVIQNVDVPVLVIPPHSTVKELDNIVLASDLDFKHKEKPLQILKSFANIYDAKINILHIQEEEGNASGGRELVDRVFGDTPHSYTISSQKDDIDDQILAYCEEKKADLVTAITKRYGFFEGLFRKSLTSQLAYHTKIPMLALHEPE